MNKIPTIFDRDWDGNRGVIPTYGVHIPRSAIATEKVDGTNVRLTVRKHKLIRLEKRRNPTKREKLMGIKTPWYVDADEYSPQDKYIWDAAKNTSLEVVPDGGWSGEAVGEKIQGNPLNLTGRTVFLFSVLEIRDKVVFKAPIPETYPRGRGDKVYGYFFDLKEWLFNTKSKFGNDCPIEGIVWWDGEKPIGKIKLKDFKKGAKEE